MYHNRKRQVAAVPPQPPPLSVPFSRPGFRLTSVGLLQPHLARRRGNQRCVVWIGGRTDGRCLCAFRHGKGWLPPASFPPSSPHLDPALTNSRCLSFGAAHAWNCG